MQNSSLRKFLYAVLRFAALTMVLFSITAHIMTFYGMIMPLSWIISLVIMLLLIPCAQHMWDNDWKGWIDSLSERALVVFYLIIFYAVASTMWNLITSVTTLVTGRFSPVFQVRFISLFWIIMSGLLISCYSYILRQVDSQADGIRRGG